MEETSESTVAGASNDSCSPSPPAHDARENFIKLGEIRLPTDEDFDYVASLADTYEDWTQKYSKNGMSVWTKDTLDKNVKLLKVQTEFEGLSPEVMYDMVHDSSYRKQWDDAMMEDDDICRLEGGCSDIGYYAMKCPMPLKNRDFVNQRSWRVKENEYIIFSHSVAHEKYPPKPQFIRGITYVTGYLIRRTATGCHLTYITQSDPKGHVPKWILNLVFTKVAPRIVTRLRKAADAYEKWKQNNNPDHKPWLHPEQSTLPEVSIASLQSCDQVPLSPKTEKASEEEEEEEGDEAPDGMPIDPLLVNGDLNGHS